MDQIEIPQETVNFFIDLEEYKINHEFNELQSSRGKINYERILKKLEKVELPNPLYLVFSTLTKQELTETITEILCKIFGSDIKPTIESYNKLLRYKKFDNPFQADLQTSLQAIDGSEKIFQLPINIFISNKCASIQVVSTGHEYIHCLVSKYITIFFNDVLNNIHYKELLPIIVEYIVCYELSLILKNENLREKHQIFRINHDKDQAIELSDCRKLKPMLQKKFRGQNLKELPIMKYIEYQEHNAFTYIIADIYGSYLCNIYQTSPKELINIIKGIFNSGNCINDLISYFNLSLINTEIIDNYNRTIDSLSLQKNKEYIHK